MKIIISLLYFRFNNLFLKVYLQHHTLLLYFNHKEILYLLFYSYEDFKFLFIPL